MGHQIRQFGLLLLGALVIGCTGSGGGGGVDDAAAQVDGRSADRGALEDLAPDLVPPASHGPVFDPDGTDFLSIPFPSDALRGEDGRLQLGAFPNPAGQEIVGLYIDAAAQLDGFSAGQVIYFAFQEPADVSGLPEWIPGDAAQPVQLVDVTPGDALGERVPLLWRWMDEATDYLPGDVLSLRPVPGAALAPGHSYAALVTTDLPSNPPLEVPLAFRDAMAGEGPVGSSLAPLAAWLEGEPGLAARVVVATVFTVDDPLDELRRIRDAIWSGPAPTGLRNFKLAGSGDDWFLYDAEYDAPEFLAGESPYAEEGGGFEFDAAGVPVVQRTVTLRVAISVPRNQPMPADGWPVALTAHGTLGWFHSFAFSEENDTASALGRHGIGGTGLDQPLHGHRAPYSLSDEMLELYSFNFQNPAAGRTVQRQSVADQIYLLRLIHEGQLVVPADVSVRGVEEHFDPSRVLFFGHSQGGTTGALLFGVEDRIRGGVLSGAGAGLSSTLVLKSSPLDFKVITAVLLGLSSPDELDEFHPALSLVQLLFDALDPLSYAGRWLSYDPSDSYAQPRSVLLTEGMLDSYTPPQNSETLAAAGGLPVLEPYVSWSIGAQALAIAPVSQPVTGNLPAGDAAATGVLIQYPEDGHFAVYDNDLAFETYSDFLGTLVDGPGELTIPQGAGR